MTVFVDDLFLFHSEDVRTAMNKRPLKLLDPSLAAALVSGERPSCGLPHGLMFGHGQASETTSVLFVTTPSSKQSSLKPKLSGATSNSALTATQRTSGSTTNGTASPASVSSEPSSSKVDTISRSPSDAPSQGGSTSMTSREQLGADFRRAAFRFPRQSRSACTTWPQPASDRRLCHLGES